MAQKKKATPKKTESRFKLSSVLTKRVDTGNSGNLGKDVKAPKWLRAIGGYFVGSWKELREVRWPTRRATWGLTSAVIVFTLVLVVFILALDYGFEAAFKQVLL